MQRLEDAVQRDRAHLADSSVITADEQHNTGAIQLVAVDAAARVPKIDDSSTLASAPLRERSDRRSRRSPWTRSACRSRCPRRCCSRRRSGSEGSRPAWIVFARLFVWGSTSEHQRRLRARLNQVLVPTGSVELERRYFRVDACRVCWPPGGWLAPAGRRLSLGRERSCLAARIRCAPRRLQARPRGDCPVWPQSDHHASHRRAASLLTRSIESGPGVVSGFLEASASSAAVAVTMAAWCSVGRRAFLRRGGWLGHGPGASSCLSWSRRRRPDRRHRNSMKGGPTE
jgi:hypothetical protein